MSTLRRMTRSILTTKVEYSGQWYHIDPQMIDDYIRIENGKVTYPRPIVLMAGHLTYQPSGLPNTAERDIVLR